MAYSVKKNPAVFSSARPRISFKSQHVSQHFIITLRAMLVRRKKKEARHKGVAWAWAWAWVAHTALIPKIGIKKLSPSTVLKADFTSTIFISIPSTRQAFSPP